MTPPVLSDQQVILGITLIFAVATACQAIAPRLRIPSLVLLLPAGFVLGILVPGANAFGILGPAFGPIVDIVVAIILFQGGMELSMRNMSTSDGNTGLRLVWIGGPITWAAATVLIALIIGLPFEIALLAGAILSVSGPTVVNPLLDVVRPHKRLRNVLIEEGTVLDPLGALVAVIVFQAIKAGTTDSVGDDIGRFFLGLLVAIVFAALGLVVTYLGEMLVGRTLMLGTQVLLGGVILATGLANLVTDNAGLLTALLMGIGATHLAPRLGRDITTVRPFFDTIVSIAIGVLFVGISALVPASALVPLILPTLAVLAVLVLVVRPAVAFIATIGRGFTWRERLFIGWMAPRGIVAAATAASVATTLIALKVPGAGDLLPVAFMIIAGTVLIYGLTATPVAKLLGVRDDDT
ncbi:MAG: cation:proton antiporter [Acidobacteria bacterium]|nr:cation:proton antiporter [Acidobacteriota bacterium]